MAGFGDADDDVDDGVNATGGYGGRGHLDDEVERLRALHMSTVPGSSPPGGGYQTSAAVAAAASSASSSSGRREEVFETYDTSHSFPRMLRAVFGGGSDDRRGGGSGGGGGDGVFSDDEAQGQELSSAFTTDPYADVAPGLAAPPAPAAADAQKGCAHCTRLYRESDNGPDACRFHSGRYAVPAGLGSQAGRSGPTKRRWTCCRAEAERAEGCTAGPHQEDVRMTQILNTFNAAAAEAPGDDQGDRKKKKKNGTKSAGTRRRGGKAEDDSSSDTDSSSSEDEAAAAADGDEDDKAIAASLAAIKTPVEKTPEGDILHLLKKSDTLQGLSLQYGVPVTEIKRRNRIMNDRDLFMFSKLKIPPPRVQKDDPHGGAFTSGAAGGVV